MGILNSESKGRCQVASSLFRTYQYDKIIVPGWAYRADSQLTISSRMKDYLVNSCRVPSSVILEEPRSRDTVGDAVFCRLSLNDYLEQITNLTVVSSDYHVSRAVRIFKFVFGRDVFVDSLCSFRTQHSSALEHSEAASLEAFENTFTGVLSGDINGIVERLTNRHPFYNGKKYPRLPNVHLTS